jgi:hypothetical protein
MASTSAVNFSASDLCFLLFKLILPPFHKYSPTFFNFSHLIDIFRHFYVGSGTTLFEIVLELTSKILAYINLHRPVQFYH